MLKKLTLVVFLFLVLTLVGCGTDTGTTGNTSATTATSAPTSAPTATPTPAPKIIINIKEFSGHLSGGNWYDSPYFTVPNNWQVIWRCVNGEQGLPLVTIAAYDHSGNPLPGDDDIAARGRCADSVGFGAIQAHGGTIHLHIYAQGEWSITVQALK
jgi:hypothetical protein